MAHDPKSHVMDSHEIEFFTSLFDDKVVLHLPEIFGLQITKFMVLELIAAALILLIYIPLARRARTGALPRGAWWNAFESLLTFVRNEIAKPNLEAPADHHHDDHGHGHDDKHGHDHAHGHDAHGHGHKKPGSEADLYVPYLWTVFLFILFCNLLGMIPFMGSPTASIYVTAAMALISFVMLHGAAVVSMGPGKYLRSLWPGLKIDIPGVGGVMGFVISLLLCILEVFGTVIKSGVLAIRLFANMFAGHMVLATILLFIITVGHAAHHFTAMWGVVTFFSVMGVVALSLLELFVAFLQAYVFTFLTALFMGMALHPQH